MKNITPVLNIAFVVILASCGTTKKSTTTASSTAPTTSTNTSSPFPLVQPIDGSPAPGNDALAAIQLQYKDVTLEKLKEGHEIYKTGACTNCHGAADISQYDVTKWKEIIDEMAPKAYLSDAQKDAVYKYVLSIKATQAK